MSDETPNDGWVDLECPVCKKMFCMTEESIKVYGRNLKCWDCLMIENSRYRDNLKAAKEEIKDPGIGPTWLGRTYKMQDKSKELLSDATATEEEK